MQRNLSNAILYYKVLKLHDFEIAQLKENRVAQDYYNDLSYTSFELHGLSSEPKIVQLKDPLYFKNFSEWMNFILT